MKFDTGPHLPDVYRVFSAHLFERGARAIICHSYVEATFISLRLKPILLFH